MHQARVRGGFLIVMLLMSAVLLAQGGDSVVQKAQAYAASKFAIARPLNIEFSNTGSYRFSSKLRGVPSIGGEVQHFSQLKASATINFVRKKDWLLSATLGYRFISVQSDIVKPVSNIIETVDGKFHYQFSSLNFSWFSKLFNKRTIYTASVSVDGSEKHFERVKGMITGTMVLKADQRTRMMAGVLINIDPSAQSPFLPTFAYEHKFRDGIILDILLPRSILVRKHVFSNGRVSAGTEMDRTSFYLYNVDGTSQKI